MRLPVFLVLLRLSCSFAAQSEGSAESEEPKYPVKVHELGDFVVKQPILETPPEGAVILPPPEFPAALMRPRSIKFISQPALLFLNLERITTLLMERTVPEMIKFLERSPNGAFNFSPSEIHYINLLKYHVDHFNPSILENIKELERIVAFGAVFFRIFKASYPGLFRVQISRDEIVDLALIASGWSMDFSEENSNDKDVYLKYCLRIYHPEMQNGFHMSLMDLYKANETIAFEAALQLNIKRIPNRSMILLENIKVKNVIDKFLHNREMFLRLLPGVRDINDAAHCYSKEGHILFVMIARGLFYPEAMLRPELKDLRIGVYDQYYFEDFYSEALYYVISFKNVEAIKFLLNLDNSYYEVPVQEAEEDSDTDSVDSDFSVETPYHFNHPPPISPETLTTLRLIFLSSSVDEVLQQNPDVYRFTFCGWNMLNIMSMFKDTFPSVMRLYLNYNRLMEERYRDRVPSPVVGEKRRRVDRSNSPPIKE